MAGGTVRDALVAGVDSSTQSCKVVIRRLGDGAIVREGRAGHPAGTEVDPEAWWRALGEAVSGAGGLDDVVAISVAGQQHGLVALADDGTVVRPALLWNDTRSGGAAAALAAEVGREEYARRSGVVPVASFTAAKLRWVRDAEPQNARRIAAVALPHDWLSWRLRGYGPEGVAPRGARLEELTTDRSDASGTAYWSPGREAYDRDLVVLALGHEPLLPRVLAADDVAGPLDPAALPGVARAPYFRGAIVAAGCGDNAGAALGLGLGTGDAAVSLGTSGTVFAVSAAAVVDPSGTVAGFADAAGQYLPLVATLNAARVLTSAGELLSADVDALADLALQSRPGADGVVLIPWFEGERTPDLPTARASLHGLTLANTQPATIARSFIEGMLCGLADGVDAVTALSGAPNRLLLIGGAARNRAVQRVAAEVFDAPVTVPEAAEYVALGAGVQAAWASEGARPDWAPVRSETLEQATVPVIRQQYRAVAAREGTHFARKGSAAGAEAPAAGIAAE